MRCAAPASCWGSIRCTSPMKDNFWPWSPPKMPTAALDALRATPGGAEAALIGEVSEQPAGAVLVTTLYGGSRIVDMLVGDPLPRIC